MSKKLVQSPISKLEPAINHSITNTTHYRKDQNVFLHYATAIILYGHTVCIQLRPDDSGICSGQTLLYRMDPSCRRDGIYSQTMETHGLFPAPTDGALGERLLGAILN